MKPFEEYNAYRASWSADTNPEIIHTPWGTTTSGPSILNSPFDLDSTAIYKNYWTDEEIILNPSEGRLDTKDFLMRRLVGEEESKVKIDVARDVEHGTYSVRCNESRDLLPDKILTTLSALKGRLMLEIAPVHIQKVTCTMSDAVRKNVLEASRKLKMYGKKMPIVARFDEYGRPLPETISINGCEGIDLKIVGEKGSPDLFIKLEAIEFGRTTYTTDYGTTVTYKTEREPYTFI